MRPCKVPFTQFIQSGAAVRRSHHRCRFPPQRTRPPRHRFDIVAARCPTNFGLLLSYFEDSTETTTADFFHDLVEIFQIRRLVTFAHKGSVNRSSSARNTLFGNDGWLFCLSCTHCTAISLPRDDIQACQVGKKGRRQRKLDGKHIACTDGTITNSDLHSLYGNRSHRGVKFL